MAQIQPFNGLRFTEKAGDIGQLCCPPYDIISEEERQAYLQTNPNNIIRLELPREGADFYQTAGDTLRRFLNDGILKCDDRPALYVYEMQFENDGEPMAVKGMICRVKLEEFSKGIILPHEETLSKAKEDRFQLMRATGCNFSQIYLLYTDPQRTTDQKIADATLRAAEVQCTDADEVVHRLWTLDDPALIDSICADFTDRRLYIADGHHRYETALRYRDDCRSRGIDAPGADYCMMMLVSMEHEGLLVLPTHRIVRDLPGFDPAAVLHACNTYFSVEQITRRQMQPLLKQRYDAGQKAFALYLGGGDYRLLTLRDPSVMQTLLPDTSAAYQGLDVNVLHKLVLERLFGIDKQNMANQKNLTYTRYAQQAVEAVDSGAANCAFLLNPTKVSEIRDVAAAGEKMPQKSTYFYPKLITGLVMNKLL